MRLRTDIGGRTFVGFADNPGGCVADAKVEDFAREDGLVKRLHELRDLCEISVCLMDTLKEG